MANIKPNQDVSEVQSSGESSHLLKNRACSTVIKENFLKDRDNPSNISASNGFSKHLISFQSSLLSVLPPTNCQGRPAPQCFWQIYQRELDNHFTDILKRNAIAVF